MKQIIIIGGGISGLSTLHFLKKKFFKDPEISIHLLEKDQKLGGLIQTYVHPNFLFEGGPHGFLNNKEHLLQLIIDLKLQNSLIPAQSPSKSYVCLKNKLYGLPQSLTEILSFSPLSFTDKFKVLLEFFVSPGANPDETVYDFAARRFGSKVAKIVFDSLMNGIFAGDSTKLNLKSALPAAYELEQKFGSVIKGFMKSKKQKGQLMSLNKGMSQLIESLHYHYKTSISTGVDVKSIEEVNGRFVVSAMSQKYEADQVFLCTPAPIASEITRSLNKTLSDALGKIEYSPIAVCGLLYKKTSLRQVPPGYGYLVPSTERKPVLGVLFESYVFPQKNDEQYGLMRVLLGGVHYPDIVNRSKDELLRIAKDEMKNVLNISDEPLETVHTVYPLAIPQYTTQYVHLSTTIGREISKMSYFHIVANYSAGVSVGDCVLNAQTTVTKNLIKK